MQRSRNDASESIRTADLPLPPEVIQCMDVQSLGRYTCCSATVRKHAREAKAWQLLSNVQRPAEDAFFAAARDATAARRSQALRRRVADQLDRWRAGGPMFLNRPITTFADYTFFLRIDDDQGRIWEGDLAPSSQRLPQATEAITVVGFDMSEIWAAWKERNRMMAFLATDPSDPDDWRGYLDSLRISLVAVTASSLIRLRRNLVKRWEKKFHNERARFERVRRARRVAVCGFRKSLIHPPVSGGWENV